MIVREAVVSYRKSDAKIDRRRIFDSRALADLARGVIPDGPQERVIVVGLDTKNIPVGWTLVSAGGLAESVVEVGQVFRWALIAGVYSIALVHNHPSGDPTPSGDDITLTRRVVEAGDLLRVHVLDHVVLGDGRHFSFLDAGLMKGK